MAWEFLELTIAAAEPPFSPPLPSGVTLDAEGNPTGDPTGENNVITLRRLIVAANNKIFYEDI